MVFVKRVLSGEPVTPKRTVVVYTLVLESVSKKAQPMLLLAVTVFTITQLCKYAIQTMGLNYLNIKLPNE
jgi:hypothetical protein